MYDFDKDGEVRLWEISGVLAINARNKLGKNKLPTIDSSSMPFGEPILDTLKRPTLAMYGSLDEYQSCHAVILSEKLSEREWLDLRVVPNVGHQLGPEAYLHGYEANRGESVVDVERALSCGCCVEW